MAFTVYEKDNLKTIANVVYDTNTLSWVRMTQPVIDGGSVVVSGTLTVSGTVSTKNALTASAPASGTVGITSASIVSSNSSRKSLIIKNLSNNTISLGLAQTAVLYSGITLSPYEIWNMNEYSFVTGAINAIADVASSNVSIQEFS